MLRASSAGPPPAPASAARRRASLVRAQVIDRRRRPRTGIAPRHAGRCRPGPRGHPLVGAAAPGGLARLRLAAALPGARARATDSPFTGAVAATAAATAAGSPTTSPGRVRGHAAGERLTTVSHGAGPSPPLDGQRRAAADLVARAIPEPEGGLASGILIGIRERVSREVSDAFATTGPQPRRGHQRLEHRARRRAWSAGCCAAMGLGRRSRSVLVVVAIAALHAAVGRERQRRARRAHGRRWRGRGAGSGTRRGPPARSASPVWVLVLVEPTMVADIGFQLSRDGHGRPAGAGRTGRRPGHPGDARAVRRAGSAETLGVSLAAQLATLPLVLLPLRPAFAHLTAGQPGRGTARAAGDARGGARRRAWPAGVGTDRRGPRRPSAPSVRGCPWRAWCAGPACSRTSLWRASSCRRGRAAWPRCLRCWPSSVQCCAGRAAPPPWPTGPTRRPRHAATPPASPTGRRRRLAIGAMTLALVALGWWQPAAWTVACASPSSTWARGTPSCWRPRAVSACWWTAAPTRTSWCVDSTNASPSGTGPWTSSS